MTPSESSICSGAPLPTLASIVSASSRVSDVESMCQRTDSLCAGIEAVLARHDTLIRNLTESHSEALKCNNDLVNRVSDLEQLIISLRHSTVRHEAAIQSSETQLKKVVQQTNTDHTLFETLREEYSATLEDLDGRVSNNKSAILQSHGEISKMQKAFTTTLTFEEELEVLKAKVKEEPRRRRESIAIIESRIQKISESEMDRKGGKNDTQWDTDMALVKASIGKLRVEIEETESRTIKNCDTRIAANMDEQRTALETALSGVEDVFDAKITKISQALLENEKEHQRERKRDERHRKEGNESTERKLLRIKDNMQHNVTTLVAEMLTNTDSTSTTFTKDVNQSIERINTKLQKLTSFCKDSQADLSERISSTTYSLSQRMTDLESQKKQIKKRQSNDFAILQKLQEGVPPEEEGRRRVQHLAAKVAMVERTLTSMQEQMTSLSDVGHMFRRVETPRKRSCSLEAVSGIVDPIVLARECLAQVRGGEGGGGGGGGGRAASRSVSHPLPVSVQRGSAVVADCHISPLSDTTQEDRIAWGKSPRGAIQNVSPGSPLARLG